MRKVASFALIAALAGCSIHPRPEDYLNVSTYQIVERIRCESRAGVLNSITQYLYSRDDADTIATLARYKAAGLKVKAFNPNDFEGDVGKMLRLFWRTGVAFNFTLDMTEVNNLGGELNFLKPLTNVGWNVKVKADLDRQRQNVRTFTVTDDFAGLLKMSPGTCADKIVDEDFIYPITGKIGVEKMIHAFVYLSLFQNLTGTAENRSGPPSLVDALAFTTTVSGSATPKVTFAPVGRGFQIGDASVSGTVTRTDVHKVVIGLALDPVGAAQIAEIRSNVSPRLISATPRTAAQTAAAIAVDRFLLQQAYSPIVILNQ